MKFPFPGFSSFTLITADGFLSEINSDNFFADRPNTPQDLHASIRIIAPLAGDKEDDVLAISPSAFLTAARAFFGAAFRSPLATISEISGCKETKSRAETFTTTH